MNHLLIKISKYFYRAISLPDVELYSGGGLTVLAWLEGPGGRVEADSLGGKTPTFPIVMGTNYEVISAVFGNGKMLARLANFSIHIPTELKERQKKKYGQSVPLVAFKSDRWSMGVYSYKKSLSFLDPSC